MKIFTIENQRPVIVPEMLMIKEFRDIWDRDTDTTKVRATKELAYVYFMEIFDSVYDQYAPNVKSSKIIKDVINPKKKSDFDEEDKLIIAARNKLQELQVTPTYLFYMDLKATLTKMQGALLSLDFSKDVDGKIMEKFLNILKKSEDSITSLNKIKELAIKEATSIEKVKGGAKVSNRERHPKDRG